MSHYDSPEKPSPSEVEVILCISTCFFIERPAPIEGYRIHIHDTFRNAQYLTLTCVLGSRQTPLDSTNEEVENDDAVAPHSAEAGVPDFVQNILGKLRHSNSARVCPSMGPNNSKLEHIVYVYIYI